MRTLIRGGWVVGYKEPTHTLIREGVVVFEGDKIIHVGRNFDGPIDRVIDGTGKLVAPGFIDTHVHAGHRASHRLISDVGRPDYFGQPYLEITTTRPGARVGGDPRHAAAGDDSAKTESQLASLFTVAELLRNGVTTFVEFGANLPVQEALLVDIERFGIRGYLGPGYSVMRRAANEIGRLVNHIDLADGQRRFDQAIGFVKRIEGTVGGRVNGILVPHGVDVSSVEQIRATTDLARDLNMPVAIHASYNVLEFYECVREHLKTPIELLESLDLLKLGPTLNIGHGNLPAEHPRIAYSGGHDVELMGEHGCTVSHCPTNYIRRARFLDSWPKYRKAGVNLTIGSDCHPRDLVMHMRMASYMGKITSKDLSAASAAQVFEAATLNPARSLNRADLGRLAPGAKADIILIDQSGIDSLRYGPVRDPIKSLVECGVADDVHTVIVDGVIRMENRVIPGLDLGALKREAQAAGEWIWNHWQDWDPTGRTDAEVCPWSYPLSE